MEQDLLLILFRPIAKFCVRRSVKLQTLTDVFKQLLVSAAEEELSRNGESANSSRLSVMTGVHRKDVKKILETSTPRTESKNIVTRIIGQWQQAAAYTTKSGRPRTLSVEGDHSEFAELVRSVSVDLNPYTILFELERIGAVERTSRGLRLVHRFYLAAAGEIKEGYHLLAQDLSDLICCVDENIRGEADKQHLHLRTDYDRVPAKHIDRIKSWLLKEGSSFHQRASKFISKYDQDVSPKQQSADSYSRISIASFTYNESSSTEE